MAQGTPERPDFSNDTRSRVKPRARPKRGFLLGKFMPPHNGHVFLCEFARTCVEELTILVCSLPDDPIAGELRTAWMKEMFPTCRVISCSEKVPQTPEDDPENFWPIWQGVVRRFHPESVDVVFASEPYGVRLAKELNARFIPCDLARATRPCSGTAIRNAPYDNWDCIPAPVRPYFVKRICLFGPESSGKTTLAMHLAERFGTVLVPEYGRTYTQVFGTRVQAEDLRYIVEGHVASVNAAKRFANRILIEDTDPLLSAVWSDMLLGERDPWFASFNNYAELYLLCDIDFPWENDGTRYFAREEDRRRFFRACKRELDARGVKYLLVSGSLDERLGQATQAIQGLLKPHKQGTF
jgi:HTH-type transcriptional regulator, transcriptional repressor of NAD biosynthesis genes